MKLASKNLFDQAKIMSYPINQRVCLPILRGVRHFNVNSNNTTTKLLDISGLAHIAATSNDFEELIMSKAIYIDKTEKIANLLMHPDKFFLLTRPRRMGKSLTLDIIERIYQGMKKKELFKGTWLGSTKNQDVWSKIEEYPVNTLYMPHCSEERNYNETLCDFMVRELDKKKIVSRSSNTPGFLLNDLIIKTAERSPKGKCVLLFDEYDNPLTSSLKFGRKKLKNAEVVYKNFTYR